MKKFILIIFILSLNHINANSNTVLFLGDSLTEGYGLNKEEAYPKLVQDLILKKLKKEVSIINGAVSGSTTNDALARLKWYLRKKPTLIFIALGANDGLRGLKLEKSQKNLEQIIEFAQKSKAKVLLAGMLIPPNYGPEYSENFKKMYENLSLKYSLKTMAFLLKDVAGIKELNQEDGIHPNEEGHKIIAKNVFEFIKEEL